MLTHMLCDCFSITNQNKRHIPHLIIHKPCYCFSIEIQIRPCLFVLKHVLYTNHSGHGDGERTHLDSVQWDLAQLLRCAKLHLGHLSTYIIKYSFGKLILGLGWIGCWNSKAQYHSQSITSFGLLILKSNVALPMMVWLSAIASLSQIMHHLKWGFKLRKRYWYRVVVNGILNWQHRTYHIINTGDVDNISAVAAMLAPFLWGPYLGYLKIQ